ncbi:restriction endonuclease [Rhizobium laguerreae]|uniref:restriction endonuclease n=1 Tax=Rhizobium laguerreae TaxID=1076926 RepID=UPI001C929261|nr:restriction endonuclease [Rhizobium laguerreae]MBY3243170.1 restriction endonuclease [Rhizobium laguerreae]
MPILDFIELSTSKSNSPAGEDLEGLVRELGKLLGLSPEWSGRGADQGRDLFFTEIRKGAIGARNLRWLVSCKDFAKSGRSVSEADVGSVLDKVAQHKADGFLLVATTTVSTGLKSLLDGLNEQGVIETQVWDRHELEHLLFRDANVALIKRFLPESYSAYQRLSSLPQALESLKVLVPPAIYRKIQTVVETYHVEDNWISGERIWAHDAASARTIDRALSLLFEGHDPAQAAQELAYGEIEFDAFEATLKTLGALKPTETAQLCRDLVKAKNGEGPSLFAFRFYTGRYEPSNQEQIALAVDLSAEDLEELYGDEISGFICEELETAPEKYRAWGDLDSLSTHTTLERAQPYDLSVRASTDRSKIEFVASVEVSVELSYDKETAPTSMSFPGKIQGYIDPYGIYIEDFTVDTHAFYE